MVNFTACVVDVQGAFLLGYFDNDEVLYCKIPEGFEDIYDPEIYCWRLLKTAYGLKQAAKMFWVKLHKAMKQLGFKRRIFDPCAY